MGPFGMTYNEPPMPVIFRWKNGKHEKAEILTKTWPLIVCCIVKKECKPATCKNGGTCTEIAVGRHLCTCPVGFLGDDCEGGWWLELKHWPSPVDTFLVNVWIYDCLMRFMECSQSNIDQSIQHKATSLQRLTFNKKY